MLPLQGLAFLVLRAAACRKEFRANLATPSFVILKKRAVFACWQGQKRAFRFGRVRFAFAKRKRLAWGRISAPRARKRSRAQRKRSRRISCVRICVAPFKRFLGYARNDGACEKSQCRQAAGRANKIFPPSRIFVKHRCQKRKRHSCLKTAFPRIYNLFDVRLTGRTAAGRPHGKWIISSLINPAPQSGAGSNSIDFYFRAVWSVDRPAPSGEILLCVRLSLQETGK